MAADLVPGLGFKVKGVLTHKGVRDIKHKLQIYRLMCEYHVPEKVRKYILMKKGICFLQKFIPYKESK
jgi:hypothetical protein